MTMVSGTVTYPLDTVLRRLMVDSGRPPEFKQFKGTMHAITSIYKKGGIRSFYRVDRN